MFLFFHCMKVFKRNAKKSHAYRNSKLKKLQQFERQLQYTLTYFEVQTNILEKLVKQHTSRA